ncbi:RNA-binding S4 domain-containing protein [candidate division KSB1 bacterium]|nr:MAG: RNA-binding S4 domain-containing protein [candidate division KSB1 bacterium]
MKIRIDIWLHRSRMFKSRTQATSACREGKIMINEKFADAGDNVAEGDTVKIRMRGLYRAYLVKEAADINLSKQDAKRMYEEVTAPDALEKFRQVESAYREWRTGAKKEAGPRPTKKSRRDMDKMRGKS